MIRKSAAIATIVVLIFVIAISIVKVSAQPMQVHVLDRPNVELGVCDEGQVGLVCGSDLMVGTVMHTVESDVEVSTVVKDMPSFVAVRNMSSMTVDPSAVCDDLDVCAVSV
jgi:hypothetical protein